MKEELKPKADFYTTPFTWKGLRYEPKEAIGDELIRYECDEFPFNSWVVLLTRSGQWMAAFTNGLYSFEHSKEFALEQALHKHLLGLYDKIERCEEVQRRRWDD